MTTETRAPSCFSLPIEFIIQKDFSSEKRKKMLETKKRVMDRPYNLLSANCVHAVVDTLEAGGVDVDANVAWIFPVPTPGKFEGPESCCHSVFPSQILRFDVEPLPHPMLTQRKTLTHSQPCRQAAPSVAEIAGDCEVGPKETSG